MKFDKFGLIEMEEHPEGDPGNIGDSCAETFRWYGLAAMAYFLDDHLLPSNIVEHVADLYNRIHTDHGYLRHPLAPDGWRESDFSDDQATALFLGLDAWGLDEQAAELSNSILKSGGKTGNGQLVHPNFIAADVRFYNQPSNLSDTSYLFQAWGMKYIPFRWSDSKKEFEPSKDSSADFLNWAHLIFQAERHGKTWVSERAKKVFTADQVMEKVNAYYADEPNPIVLQMYEPVVRKVFRVS